MASVLPIENTVTITGIRFRPASRIYNFDPQGKVYANGQYVIVETSRGTEAGRVVIASKKMAEGDLSDPLKPILRLATEDELRMMLSFKSKEKEAIVHCQERVLQHKLPMKLIEAEYTYDGGRLTFYFTAEERVDFRALVRDLAATFRTRIELRQIGARDQAKQQGGVGPCGKALCCSSWISDFGVVSIKMAKEQGLPLNPTKISGICGRLLCCLSYENENYVQAKQQMPQIGAMLSTSSGSGKVVSVNVPKDSVDVMLESGAIIQVPAHPPAVNNTETSIACGNGSCGSGGGCGAKKGGCGSCGSGGACGCSRVSSSQESGCNSCGVKKKLQV